MEQHGDTYRAKLMAEYDNILLQAKISFALWMTSILICFGMIITSMILLIRGAYIQGIATAVLDAFVIAIQKLFNIREDHYRAMVERKIRHLEAVDSWDYAFERAGYVEDPKERISAALKILREIKENTKDS